MKLQASSAPRLQGFKPTTSRRQEKMSPWGSCIFLQSSRSCGSCWRDAAPLISSGQKFLRFDELGSKTLPASCYIAGVGIRGRWAPGKPVMSPHRSPWQAGHCGKCLLSQCLNTISHLLSPSGTPGYKQGSAVPLLLGKELSWSLLASFHSTMFLHQPMFTPLSAKYFTALETQLSSCSLQMHGKSPEIATTQREEKQ